MMKFSGFGVNCSLNESYTHHDIDIIIQHLTELGVSWIRWEFDFFSKDRNISVEEYALQQLNNHNITVIGLLCGIVPGTISNITNPQKSYNPIYNNLQDFETFVKDIVTRYHSIITHRQIWNEPNTKRFWISRPKPNAYISMVQRTSRIIKSIQQESIILCGGIFYDPSQQFLPNYNKSFMKECIALGIDKYIDIYTIHPYSLSCYIGYQDPNKLITTTVHNIQERVHYSGIPSHKPIRVTEFGISQQWTLYTPQQIAFIYQELYKILHTYYIPFCIWNICDFGNKNHGLGNPEKSFGLLTHDYRTKKQHHELQRYMHIENKK